MRKGIKSMAEVTKVNDEEYINKMYDSSLAGQKQNLQTNYEQNVSDLQEQQRQQQRQTDANLNRTYVEATKAAKNYGEVQNAYGLTSGAMAQARLAQDNQLQQDLTTIRAAQQESDAQIDRKRAILSQQYASAIAQAQADNDLQRAQALYQAAKDEEERLLQQQKEDNALQQSRQEAAAKMMANAGDFSLYAQLYGLTPEQQARLQSAWEAENGVGSGYTGKVAPLAPTPTPEPEPAPAETQSSPAKSIYAPQSIVRNAGGNQSSPVTANKKSLSSIMSLYK